MTSPPGDELDWHQARGAGESTGGAPSAPGPPAPSPVLNFLLRVNQDDTPGQPPSANSPPSDAGDTCRSSTEYKLLRVLAEGGLGRVWLARDAALPREVAIKQLRPDHLGDSGLLARLLREARIHARLQHPNIAPFFHMGWDNKGHPFLVMHRIAGQTLEAMVRALGNPPIAWPMRQYELRQLLIIFLKICDGVAFAHSRGILHRDLKPANVMVGEFGEVFVLDWGLAKEMATSEDDASEAEGPTTASTPDHNDATQAGEILGSLAYMAPEQAGGRDVIGPAADIYGLGAILYFILTQRPPHPFTASDTQEFARRVIAVPVEEATTANRSIPTSLAAISAKAMNMNPADRYASVAELASDLKHWLADEPVRVYQEPVWQRLARGALRHKVTMSATALTLFTAVLIGVVAQLHRWASVESLVGQQFQQLRSEVETVVLNVQAQAQRTASQVSFAAGLPSVQGICDDKLPPTEKASATARAQRVVEAFVRFQPRVLRAAIIARDGRTLAFHRSEERGGQPLAPDDKIAKAAKAILLAGSDVRTGQVEEWPPSLVHATSGGDRASVVVAAIIRTETANEIGGALVMETIFSIPGFDESSVSLPAPASEPTEWWYFDPEGRLLFQSMNIADSRSKRTFHESFPELTPLLNVEQLPASLEASRPAPLRTVVARRFSIPEFHPAAAPIMVASRPISQFAGLSTATVGYLAAGAVMVVALSVALAVMIAWTLVRMVRSI